MIAAENPAKYGQRIQAPDAVWDLFRPEMPEASDDEFKDRKRVFA